MFLKTKYCRTKIKLTNTIFCCFLLFFNQIVNLYSILKNAAHLVFKLKIANFDFHICAIKFKLAQTNFYISFFKLKIANLNI